MQRPVIGITVDNCDNHSSSGKYECAIAYCRSVTRAHGLPILLPHEPDLALHFALLCDGLLLTGGTDPRTEPFGERTHPHARPMDQRRQAFELALLDSVQPMGHKSVLGVCLGMQLMALQHGGRLDQYLPDTLTDPDIHQANRHHPVFIEVEHSVIATELGATCQTVVSHHRQSVADPGRLRIVGRAPDGVIEAIDDPSRPFYVGVQWHPERGAPEDLPGLNQGLIDRLVEFSRATSE